MDTNPLVARAEINRRLEQYDELIEAVVKYIRGYDNPAPNAIYRTMLRDRLRQLVGEPKRRISRRSR